MRIDKDRVGVGVTTENDKETAFDKPSHRVKSGLETFADLKRAAPKVEHKATKLDFALKGETLGANHNGKIPLDPDRSVAHQAHVEHMVWCRHLATHHADLNAGTRKVDAQKAFSEAAITRKARESVFSEVKVEATYDRLSSTVIAPEDTGKYLAFMVQKALAGPPGDDGRYTVPLVFLSDNHAMAATLEIKSTGDDMDELSSRISGKRYVVRFFDPNKTENYRRGATDDIGEIENLGFWQLFGTHQDLDITSAFLSLFGKDRQSQYLHQIGKGRLSAITVLADMPSGEDHFVGTRPKDDRQFSERLGLALTYGDSAEIALLHTDLSAIAPADTSNAVSRLLGARTDSSDPPPLYAALVKGHAKTVSTYVNLIKAAGITDAGQRQQLVVPEGDASGFLFHLLMTGNAKGVAIYGDVLRELGIRDAELLLVKSKEKNDSFATALASGNAEAIECYAALLAGLGPRGQDLVLALFQRRDTLPLCCDALIAGKPEVLGGALLFLRKADLRPETREKLLAAIDNIDPSSPDGKATTATLYAAAASNKEASAAFAAVRDFLTSTAGA